MLEGIICPNCGANINEADLRKKLACPHCKKDLKDRSYLDFLEYLMTNGIVENLDFFDELTVQSSEDSSGQTHASLSTVEEDEVADNLHEVENEEADEVPSPTFGVMNYEARNAFVILLKDGAIHADKNKEDYQHIINHEEMVRAQLLNMNIVLRLTTARV